MVVVVVAAVADKFDLIISQLAVYHLLFHLSSILVEFYFDQQRHQVDL